MVVWSSSVTTEVRSEILRSSNPTARINSYTLDSKEDSKICSHLRISRSSNLTTSTRHYSPADLCAFVFAPTERDHERNKPSSSELLSNLLGNIAISGGAAFMMGTSPAIPIAISCIPIIVPMSINRITDSSVLTLLSDDAKNFIKGITYVSMGQGTLAMADLVFGDLLSGFMKGIFAAMGFYISQMDDGATILPSFTVVSFVNGSIALLSAFERMSARHTPMFSGIMPLYLNYLHLSQIAHPLLCFAGAYMGWQIIKELRRSGAIASAVTQSLFPTSGTATPQTLPTSQPRVLSASTSGFAPFTGRGHSLSRQASAAVVEQ